MCFVGVNACIHISILNENLLDAGNKWCFKSRHESTPGDVCDHLIQPCFTDDELRPAYSDDLE